MRVFFLNLDSNFPLAKYRDYIEIFAEQQLWKNRIGLKFSEDVKTHFWGLRRGVTSYGTYMDPLVPVLRSATSVNQSTLFMSLNKLYRLVPNLTPIGFLSLDLWSKCRIFYFFLLLQYSRP